MLSGDRRKTGTGPDIDINSEEVIHLSLGQDEDTALIETKDGSKIVVIATHLEVAAELGLNPIDFVDPEGNNETLDRVDKTF